MATTIHSKLARTFQTIVRKLKQILQQAGFVPVVKESTWSSNVVMRCFVKVSCVVELASKVNSPNPPTPTEKQQAKRH